MSLNNSIAIGPANSKYFYQLENELGESWHILTNSPIDKRDFELICNMGYSKESFLYNAVQELNRLGYNVSIISPAILDCKTVMGIS